MSFSSLEFIIVYLPVFLCLYYIVLALSKKSCLLANIIIVIGGLAFTIYADRQSDRIINSVVLVSEIVVNYLLTVSIDYYNNKPLKARFRRFIFIFLVIIDVAVLVTYKLFIHTLPIGISFYTFTMIAYAADVYTKRIAADYNPVNVAAYFAMFPKLIQGPITRYKNFSDRLQKRKITVFQFDRSLKMFIYGLSMKVILADRIGCLFSDLQMIGFESISTPLAWLGALCYSMQLYFDFAGYSYMAIGLGGMLGFRLPANFNNPYASKTVGEFYRRWHITLGAWFRDYIYIPLGGSRKGTLLTIFNLFVVWLVTGFWHGVTWNFIIWGLYLFAFIVLEKLLIGKWLNKSKVICHIYLWLTIVVSWVIFAISDIKKLGVYLTRMFPCIPHSYSSNVNPGDYIKYGRLYGVLIVVSLFLCIPWVNNFFLTQRKRRWSGILAIVLFAMCLYYISKGMNNPFMYFVF